MQLLIKCHELLTINVFGGGGGTQKSQILS